jgi:hypothetical protein
MNEQPDPVTELCAVLVEIKGVEAVTIGGSRATGTADAESDWDLGVYYRGNIDPAPLASYGEVHLPGLWERIMNGGAWVSLGGSRSTCCCATST